MNDQMNPSQQIEVFLKSWAQTVQQCSLYGQNHQITQTAVSKLYNQVTSILDTRKDLILGIIGNEIVFDRQPHQDMSRRLSGFITNLSRMGVSKIVFSAGLTQEELGLLIKLMTFQVHSQGSVKIINEVLAEKEIKHIKISELTVDNEELFNEDIVDIDAFTRKSVERGVKFLEKSISEFSSKKEIDGKVLKQIAAGLVNSLVMNKQLLLLMSSLKLQDENLFLHNMNVCILTLMQAELLGLKHNFLVDIAGASLMHNIGFMLTQNSFGTDTYSPMSYNHELGLSGSKAVLDINECSVLAAITAFESSMPFSQGDLTIKKYGSSLNLISMMITISCHYDSLRRDSDFYREGGAEKIYETMMSGRGETYHPDLLSNFFAVLGKYPPGTLVELDSGEVALVTQASLQDINRPKVEILYDSHGEPMEKTETLFLIQKDRHGRYRKSIVESINPIHSQYTIPDKIETLKM